jgi:hypothetical protein
MIDALLEADIVASSGGRPNRASFSLQPEIHPNYIAWILTSPDGLPLGRHSESYAAADFELLGSGEGGTPAELAAHLTRTAQAVARVMKRDNVVRSATTAPPQAPPNGSTPPPAPSVSAQISDELGDAVTGLIARDNEEIANGTPAPEGVSGTGPVTDSAGDSAPDSARNSARDLIAERLPVHVAPVVGAPGTGNADLTRSMRSVLRNTQEIDLIDQPEGALVIQGIVEVGPVRSGTQEVDIKWQLLDTSGAEIGSIDQNNQVPAGTLDGSWREPARNIALAATVGLAELISKAAIPIPE